MAASQDIATEVMQILRDAEERFVQTIENTVEAQVKNITEVMGFKEEDAKMLEDNYWRAIMVKCLQKLGDKACVSSTKGTPP